MIDDLRRAGAIHALVDGVAVGLMLAFLLPAVAGARATTRLVVAMVTVSVLGALLLIGSSVAWAVWRRRRDRALVRRLAHRSAEVVAGAGGHPAAGRIVRLRLAPGARAGFAMGSRTPVAGAAWVVHAQALAPDGPRLVAALVPRGSPWRRRTSLALVLHPHDPVVAVLDDRVPPSELARADADPRWRGTDVPGDPGVLRRWLASALLVGVGIVAGLGLAALVLLAVGA